AAVAPVAAGEPGAEPPGEDPGRRGSLPEIPWSLGNTVRGLFAGLLLAVVTPILVLPFDPDFDSDGALLASQALFGLTLLVFPLGNASGWSFEGLRRAPARLGLRRFALSGLGWMLLAMLAYYLFAGLFASLVIQPDQEDVAGELGVGDENLIVAVTAVVLIVGLAPVAEEAFFRGFFFSGLRSRMSLWPAALLSGLAFGMVHATTGITTVVPLAALGVALAWLYEKTGSLWPPVIAHMINNAIALAYIT
ncbi:MAG: CPBP family intramembrane metalloprotease, partial [Actinobacteria bacterium]|nr:CPBP family intramembrane metalloprotease [Actinomycetota bacterium]